MNAYNSWRQTFNQYVYLGAAIVGAIVVASSITMLDNLPLWFTTVIVGLLILQAGAWYAAHPFLTSERRYYGLRAELDRFIDLVRQLNLAAVDPEARENFDRVKAQMQESVEAMARLAGKAGSEQRSHGAEPHLAAAGRKQTDVE